MIQVAFSSTRAYAFLDDELRGLCTIKKISPKGPHYYTDIVLEVTYKDPELEIIKQLTY